MTRLRRAIGSLTLGLASAISLVGAFVWVPADAAFPLRLAVLVLSLASAMMAVTIGAGASRSWSGVIARAGLAAAAGFLSLVPVSVLGDGMNWPAVNSWALNHGAFLLVVPAIGIVAYVAMGLVATLARRLRQGLAASPARTPAGVMAVALLFVSIFIFVTGGFFAVSTFAGPLSSGALLLLLPTGRARLAHRLPDAYEPAHSGGVSFGTGLYLRRDEDIVIDGTPPLILRRTYESGDTRSRAFGVGSSHEFESFVIGDRATFQSVAVILGDGTRINFKRTSPGTSYTNAMFEHRSTPSEYYGARMGWTGGGWALRTVDGSLVRFEACSGDSKPRPCGMVSQRDADGHSIQATRDAAGRLLRLTTDDGRWIAFDYDDALRVTRAYASTGASATYSYDATGHLLSVRTSDGVERKYGYSERGQLAAVSQPDIRLENRYDDAGRCVEQVDHFPNDDEPLTFTFAYNTAGGHMRQVEDRRSDGTWSRWIYADAGYPTSETWGHGTQAPITITYLRDPESARTTSLSVTCANQSGDMVTQRRDVDPGEEEYAKFDLLRTFCGWTEFRAER